MGRIIEDLKKSKPEFRSELDSYIQQVKLENNEDADNVLEKTTNQFLNEVTNNLIHFRYNKIIANFHQIYTEFSKLIDKKVDS